MAIVQFIKFGLVGVTNTIISYLVNVIVLFVLKAADIRIDYIIANIAAFLVGTLWAFIFNRKFVFEQKDESRGVFWSSLLKTYIAYAFTGIVLNNILSFIWVDVIGISKFIAPLINLIITVPLNFFLNKMWAFRH